MYHLIGNYQAIKVLIFFIFQGQQLFSLNIS